MRLTPAIAKPCLAGALLLTALSCGGDVSIIGRSQDAIPTAIQTDLFSQVVRPKHDLLWIIDNTDSMADKQASLKSAYTSFFQQVQQSGVSYQVGVITVGSGAGVLGQLEGDPWIITPDTPEGLDAFVTAATVPLLSTAVNSALDAMRSALSPPISTEENRGFVRSAAQLSVFIVSDSDDTSTWPNSQQLVPVSEYYHLLRSLKSDGPVPTVSGIIGPPGVGCSGSTGNATAADRIGDLISLTSGVAISICRTQDFTFEVPLSLPARDASFELSHLPASPQLGVWVDSVRQSEGAWTLSGQTLTFNADTVPEYGAQLRVQYLYELSEEQP